MCKRLFSAAGVLGLLLAALFLSACSAERGVWSADRLTYQNAPFRAEVAGTQYGVAFRGLLETYAAPDGTGQTTLIHRMTYSEPRALAGVSITDQGENGQPGQATLPGGGDLDGIDLSGWLAPVAAFTLRGTIYPAAESAAEGIAEGGRGASKGTDLVLQTQQDGRIYTLYLNGDNRPTRILADTLTGERVLDLQVVWFDDAQ